MKKKLAAFTILALFPSEAYPEMTPWIPIPSMSLPGLGVYIPTESNGGLVIESNGGLPSKKKLGVAGNVQGAVAQDSISTIYTPSKSRTRNNLANFVTKTRAGDPDGAAKMEQLFASTDVMGAIGDAMKGVGLARNNAAHAYAVYWISAWQAAQGRSDTRSAVTYQAVAEQAARGLAAAPEFARATDAQKQEMAEAMMVQAAMIDSYIETAAGNAAQIKAIAAAVAQGTKASGLDLGSMTLTDTGFVARDKSSALDPAQGASVAPTKHAATTDTTKPPYLLMATAGGAGMAGVFLLGKMVGKKG
jgi:hypothetical protein